MPPKSRKLCVLGFRQVGKSSLIIQLVDNQFVASYDPTIGGSFEHTIKHRGIEYRTTIVDTAGQDEYAVLPQSYFMDIHGYILVYSITSNKSFEVVKDVREKLLDMTGTTHVPMILVGNKSDLHMERVISSEDGKKLANSWNATFVESTAKSHESAIQVFLGALEEIERVEGRLQGGQKGGDCTLI
ncbi:GTP-binding protein Rheb [Trichoplax sp. H2]|uniref:Small monomeric GTPase n=1 Tax=Trichoplax adhaerens TaxID=10228 RepID=B3RPK3_TRIAD|nr:hypothetical protein TRIADDRAFT_53571 [Trichoplax adhaerens]EDV28205.1 hypothetical protein TRIADDRAFT_53571 [Trichoplax adhaerens]RDD45281.1 GTP-binding protein Rheb [Trichoplax sp. H2]|eukprot:XP_002110039.1 hypothetical protein TRIADDRAFT_53571 [Trichoplax adhaerens]